MGIYILEPAETGFCEAIFEEVEKLSGF